MQIDQLHQFLQVRKQKQLYRKPRLIETPQQTRVVIDGKPFLNFCSNDYLGLANHPDVIRAFQQASSQFGVGSGSAHLINGHSYWHQRLEAELAAFTNRDQALLFSTGYMANLGTIQALAERGDVIFQDRLNHASLIDGGRLSDAKMVRYRHNDMPHLRTLLEKHSGKSQLIATDGVFSMDGNQANVDELAMLAAKQQAWLMVDDAHGLGVLGKQGAGLVEQENMSQTQVPVLMATLGKALGTSGAFVAGSTDLIEYLRQAARSWVYTTAMPPALAAATSASLQLVQAEDWRREKLHELVAYFREQSKRQGIALMPSQTAIQPLMIGDTQAAVDVSRYLEEKEILVSAIRPPTVPEKTARLRVTLSAGHEKQDIDELLAALNQMGSFVAS